MSVDNNFPGAHQAGGGGCRGQGVRIPTPEMTRGFLIQLVFFPKKTLWFIGVEVKHETKLKN